MQKALVIDRHSVAVREMLAGFFSVPYESAARPWTPWDEVLQVARARHILGHYEYGDTNLFEWSDGKVRAAIIEELADAVVYQAWLEERASNDQ